MVSMRVVMVMNLSFGKLHLFLYCSHIVKAFASEFGKSFDLAANEDE
jgi:hypothetical protein